MHIHSDPIYVQFEGQKVKVKVTIRLGLADSSRKADLK